MRSLVVLLLFAAPALHAQQLGVPLSSLPGVEAGVAAAVGNAGAGGVEGINLPQGTLNRLLMAPANGRANASVGQEIERSFFGGEPANADAPGYGLQGRAARAVTGETATPSSRGSGVQSTGTAVRLPTSQQLMPANLIPGYQSARGTGAGSPTGAENVFTGSGIPRPGGSP